jgi:vacuolar protein sorting-associated protein VTA1
VCVFFSQRADEIAKIDPKVAYYCRMYAVEQVRAVRKQQMCSLKHSNLCVDLSGGELCLQGLALPNRSPQIDGVLSALLAKLEKDKASVNCGPGDQQYCENFAVTVFNGADKVDRAGRADKLTAVRYYAASVFMEVPQSTFRALMKLITPSDTLCAPARASQFSPGSPR